MCSVLTTLSLFSLWFPKSSLDMYDWNSRGRRLGIEEALLPNGDTGTSRGVRVLKIVSYNKVLGIVKVSDID